MILLVAAGARHIWDVRILVLDQKTITSGDERAMC